MRVQAVKEATERMATEGSEEEAVIRWLNVRKEEGKKAAERRIQIDTNRMNPKELAYMNVLLERLNEARSKINLCDTCEAGGYSPECGGEAIEFGDGFGNDNIIACDGYVKGDKDHGTV